ncbi:aspartate--tRNA ligase [Ureaplasma ceti]|uniref:Aspartate--tRNA ligase n=1 Tax=Ureaplasma ceti TaxID=3119530 RepID=A0ABP9U793_9BACT
METSLKRTYCGEVSNALTNQQVLIKGWIKKNRKLGKLIFMDISDRSGLVQVVANETNPNYETLKSLPRESVVEVLGTVVLRKNANDNLKNGDVEIELNDLQVDSISKTPPLIIENETDALEDLRMKFRYLDLRRPNIQKNLVFRSMVANYIRNFLINQRFVEVETPVLGKPTPEGARDYLVPSRVNKGNFYALPQSPQIYKQLLMVAGMDRYFQITKCFRDEDLRSDRQPEFTQVDMELSFTNELEIQTLIEELMKDVFKKALNVDLQTPFLRMDYNTAMNTYGCDKPDLRFGLELQDVTAKFSNSQFQVFKNAASNGQVIKCIVTDALLTKKEISGFEKFAKDMGAKGLAWVSYKDNNIFEGSIAKVVEADIVKAILDENHLTQGTVLLVADKLNVVNATLGMVRNVVASHLGLKDPNKFSFLWVVDWPLFEYDEEENRYVAAHHPFTQPQESCHATFDTNLAEAKARAYDIVLNGFEVGGGSIRITNPDMQDRMFKAIGLTPEQVESKFSYLIEAFNYGVPPHGGLALGFDRLIAIMLNLDNIKECIAFPKNTSAVDALMKAPSQIDEAALDELGIQLKK